MSVYVCDKGGQTSASSGDRGAASTEDGREEQGSWII